MAIDTLSDWNARLSCCCEMPACPIPLKEWQAVESTYTSDDMMPTYPIDCIGEGPFLPEADPGVAADAYIPIQYLYGVLVPCPPEESSVFELRAPFSLSDLATAAAAANAAAAWPADPDPPVPRDYSQIEEFWPVRGSGTWPAFPSYGDGGESRYLKTRFRWVIPDDFTGAYFKITWDVFDDYGKVQGGPYEGPVIVSSDHTWEWTGPGDPETPASWRSDWIELGYPARAGYRSICNVRFVCYRGPYGNKPQVTGFAV